MRDNKMANGYYPDDSGDFSLYFTENMTNILMNNNQYKLKN